MSPELSRRLKKIRTEIREWIEKKECEKNKEGTKKKKRKDG